MTSKIRNADVVVLTAHARHVPVAERERFARHVRERGNADGLLLETCHRVEWYGYESEPTPLSVALPAGGLLLHDHDAARHAISVAVGLDSVIAGEDQVLHQLRAAVTAARDMGRLDVVLDRLFTLALRAGRRARSWRSGRPISLADVALAEIGRRIGDLNGRPVLVVGAGEMGRLATAAATAAGARVSVTSRTTTRARALASKTRADITPFDPGPRLADVAAVIVALRGRWSIAPWSADALIGGPGVVVDLSVPPAIPPGLAARLEGRLISADAFAQADPDAVVGVASVTREQALAEATLAEFRSWLAGRSRRAAARAIAERAETDRRAELDELWRRLPSLEPEVRDAIDRMSRHLAGRILREPLERLGRDRDGRSERAARELFAL